MTVLASLHSAGVHTMEPLRFHFLEVLARRADAAEGAVKPILEARLRQAAQALQAQCEQAHSAGQGTTDLEGTPPLAPLRALTLHLAQQSAPPGTPLTDMPAGGHGELKSVRQFRNTWSRLSADRQVTLALEQAPKNAGPINSHMLVLRSVALMRDTSPDYLNRFMRYVDSLLCLDAAERDRVYTPRPATAKRAARSPKVAAQATPSSGE
jgi:hypothetical protein